MIYKVGLLVLCQFFWATDNVQVQEGEKSPEPRQMVGTVVAVHNSKEYKTKVFRGKVFAVEEDKFILEVAGTEPKEIHYFINSKSCVPVKTKEEYEKEVTDHEKKEKEATVKRDSEDSAPDKKEIKEEKITPVSNKKEQSKEHLISVDSVESEPSDSQKEEKPNKQKEEIEVKEKKEENKDGSVFKDVVNDIVNGISK